MNRILRSRWLPGFLALLGIILTAPSLTNGFILDDTVQQLMFVGPQDLREKLHQNLGMFQFLNGDPERTVRLKQIGILPWWSDPEIRISFSRPLTELSHHFDYRMWPQSATLMHLHNLFWFGLLVWVVAHLYRAVEGSTFVAGVAALLYAIDDAHSMPVAWIANRNALIATVFGVTALLIHHRWRTIGRFQFGLGSAALFLMSLLSAEAGVATAGYLLAYALCLDKGGVLEKIRSLVPHLLVGGVWFLYHRWGGFGASGSGFYIDPGREPWRFFLACLERAPILFLGQWFLPPANLSILLSRPCALGVVVFAWFFFFFVLWTLSPLLKKSATARFWALGSLLSIPPVCSVTPAERLLFFVGIGGHLLLATWLVAAFRPNEGIAWGEGLRARALKGFAYVLFPLHLILAPIGLLLGSAVTLPAVEKPVRETALSLAETGDLTGRKILILNPPSPILSAYLGPRIFVEGIAFPENIWSVVPGVYPIEVERRDEHTLILRAPKSFLLPPGTGLPGHPVFDGRYLHQGFVTLYRNLEVPFALGETVEMVGWRIEVSALDERGQPSEIALRFDQPIEASGIDWYRWEDNAVVPYSPPAVGQIEQIAPVEMKVF